MNKKIALFAIAMFAVTLGLGVLNPAMASKPVNGEHKMEICHFSEAENIFNATGDSLWHNSTAGLVVIDVDNKGKMNGHFDKNGDARHFNATLVLGDFVINGTDADPENDLEDCAPAPVLTIGP